MPFAQLFPRSFKPGSIQEFAPAASGVYGLTSASEWIYIGETDNIRAALLSHLAESDSSISTRKPTGFVWEACERAGRASRQDRLILEYEPYCNRRMTSASGSHA